MEAERACEPPQSKKARLNDAQGHQAPILEATTAVTGVINNGATIATEADVSTTDSDDHSKEGSILPFDKYRTERVLFTDPKNKSICTLGFFGECEEQRGVVVAEKQPLTESSLPFLFSSSSSVERKFQNDIYSQYVLDCKEGGLGEMRVMTICPATDKHIRKYEAQTARLVVETPDDYQHITKPYAEKQSFSLDWVFNILDGKSEVDRVIYNDADSDVGFIMVPDLKWDQKELENLYVLAIARKRGILSLRDLRAEHLPMLRNIVEAGKREICRKYSVDRDCLRAYLHYQPSYYHLHVHFTHLRFNAPKSSVGEAHLLDDVIDNIATIDPLFYAKRTLSFVLKESSELWKLFASRKNTIS